MDSREARERRAWRLAVLLVGDRERAARIVNAALAVQPDFDALPEARLERLVILRAREALRRRPARRARERARVSARERVRAGLARARASHLEARGVAAGAPAQGGKEPRAGASGGGELFHGPAAVAYGALLALPEQPKEAWILNVLDGRDLMGVSRAMDCSTTAAARHLAKAHDTMQATLGEAHGAMVDALRAQADAIDPSAFARAGGVRGRARGWRGAALWGCAAAAAAALGVVAWRALS